MVAQLFLPQTLAASTAFVRPAICPRPAPLRPRRLFHPVSGGVQSRLSGPSYLRPPKGYTDISGWVVEPGGHSFATMRLDAQLSVSARCAFCRAALVPWHVDATASSRLAFIPDCPAFQFCTTGCIAVFERCGRPCAGCQMQFAQGTCRHCVVILSELAGLPTAFAIANSVPVETWARARWTRFGSIWRAVFGCANGGTFVTSG